MSKKHTPDTAADQPRTLSARWCPLGGAQHAVLQGQPSPWQPHITRADLDRWKSLQADRRALLGALQKLVYRNQIMLNYETQGRTETRWTEKDGIAQPGAKANHDALLPALAQARAAIAQCEKGTL